MGGEDEYLGYLDVGRGVGCVYGHVGDVVAREGLDALVDGGSTICIPMKPDIAEVGLYKAGLEVAVSATSMRSPSESALTAALVAQ